MGRSELAGSARLELVSGVAQLRPEDAMFEAMLSGWRAQQAARGLREDTVADRERLVRRFGEFGEFAGEYPWAWSPGHVDEWSLHLTAEEHLAPSTIRAYQGTLRQFTEFLVDGRYGWAGACEEAFGPGRHPVAVCHEWNTIAHLNGYEGSPEARPFTRGELDRHAGLRAVPQALDHLLRLRDRSTAEGRNAPRAALRPLPQPRPGVLETLRVLPADLAAVNVGMHALLPGPETEAGPRPAGRHHRTGTGPVPRGPCRSRAPRSHAGLAEEARRPPHPPDGRGQRRRHPRGARRAAPGPRPRPRAVDAGRRGRALRRDERLTALESWVGQVIAAQADPGHRQALRGYALWHHLRRLRGRLDSRPASRQQVKNVHDQVAAAAALLDWLTAGRSPASTPLASPPRPRAGPARPGRSTRTAGGPTPGGSSTTAPARPLTGSPGSSSCSTPRSSASSPP